MSLSHYLYVFNLITSQGEKYQDKYQLGKLTAWHGLDGYTCYLGYKDLTMVLYFHNMCSWDYRKKSTLIAFHSLINQPF